MNTQARDWTHTLMAACLALAGCRENPTPGGPVDGGGPVDARDAGGEPLPAGWRGPVLHTHPVRVSGTRLKAEHVLGEDGTRQELRWWDSARSETCDARRTEDDKLRCLPYAPSVNRYSDDRCQVPLVLLPAATCSAASVYVYETLPPLTGRSPRSRLRRLGEPVTASDVYQVIIQNGSMVCQRAPAVQAGDRLFAVGAVIEPASFVEVIADDELEGAELRVAGVYRHFADGARERLYLADSQTRGICRFERASDGTERCFPMGAGAAADASAGVYGDPACTVPVTSPVPASEPPAFALVTGPFGQGGSRLFRTGARHEGPLYRRSGRSCVEERPSAVEVGVRFSYSLDEEIPPSQLGRIEPWPAGGVRLRDQAAVMIEGALFPRARISLTFYDSALDVDCFFQPVAGTQRCVPHPQLPHTYADAGCTDPVYLPPRRTLAPYPSAPEQARTLRFIALFDGGPRCSPLSVTVYEIGAPADAVFLTGSDGCTPLPGGPKGYFHPGPPVDPATFVGGEIRRD